MARSVVLPKAASVPFRPSVPVKNQTAGNRSHLSYSADSQSGKKQLKQVSVCWTLEYMPQICPTLPSDSSGNELLVGDFLDLFIVDDQGPVFVMEVVEVMPRGTATPAAAGAAPGTATQAIALGVPAAAPFAAGQLEPLPWLPVSSGPPSSGPQYPPPAAPLPQGLSQGY
ncbi:hypothetical protein UY3_04681 [Chelonia mydas]|uniref:Uncharacterized protein n=1 Tax=Chelonia mydas TaxID=8469 RepID=M7C151_CHEMY|nr:hypothetical protein UY3_04681 [Chelonia mydas]